MKRTALFFGSFNPIHVGHLVIANTIVQQDDVDELWLVVSPQNPLKERSTLLADHHRLEMVRRAIDDNYSLRVCDIEMHLPIPSYTVVTLAALGEKYPDREFCLVMGSDNLLTFNRWRNYEYILSHYRIYVYPRPGYMTPAAQTPPSPPQGGTVVRCGSPQGGTVVRCGSPQGGTVVRDGDLSSVPPRGGQGGVSLWNHPSVTMVDVPMMDISSSYIRQSIAEGRDVRYLLTDPVYKYLTEMHFYETKNEK